MNVRTAAIIAAAVSAGRKLIAFGIRLVRDEPATENERRIFVHLNGLVDAVANQFLNRSFVPTGLQVVR